MIARGSLIKQVLEELGGIANLKNIERRYKKKLVALGEQIPHKLGASIRNGLQRHCSLSPHYGGHDDWFRNPLSGEWETVEHFIERERRWSRPAMDA